MGGRDRDGCRYRPKALKRAILALAHGMPQLHCDEEGALDALLFWAAECLYP